MDTETLRNGEARFTPTSSRAVQSQLAEFVRHCELSTGRAFQDYWAFDRFSVEEFPAFWRLFLGWSRLPYTGKIDPVCVGRSCEGARFFTGLRVSYPEALLGGDPLAPAVTACHYGKPDERVSRAELHARVAARAASLKRLGVAAGDRVVAIGRNNLEVVVAALAASTIGACFSSCSPDMGAFAILARFQPLRPIVLLANLHDEPWDLGIPVSARVAEVLAGMTSLRAVIALDDGAVPHGLTVPLHRYSDLTIGGAPQVAWQAHEFNHPLFIMFSSGTTGKPKCIVHGAGGALLEHVKEHRLHCDLRAGDKLFYQTSCGWMMWNWQLSALASGVELVVYDGLIEGPETLWRLVSDQQVTVFGTSAAFLQFCEASGFAPGRACDLSALRSILSTGSILYPHQYDWVRDEVKPLPLQSISGGTDILGCFVLGNPDLPVYPGQAQCRSLGLDVQAHLPSDAPNTSVGELICANPFPSCPLGFYDDPDGRRFHEAYFVQNPGVWTHGDLIEATPQGGWILHGRSDGVINVRGIRVGPAEIYAALQDFSEIVEAMAIEQQAPNEIGGTRLILLVVLRKDASLTSDLMKRIRAQLGSRGSPALVPAVIADVAALPITYSGKRSEAAARDAVNGGPVRNRDALQNPDSLHSIAGHPALLAGSPPCQPKVDVEGVTSGDRLRRDLQQIFEEILRIAPIGWSDDLLQLGADSLMVLNLFLAAQQHLKREGLSLREFLAARTINGLAAVVEGTPLEPGHERRKRSGPQIRPAGPDHVEALCHLLNHMRAVTLPATWRNLFNYHWFGEKPDLGFMLVDGAEIVGFLGTVYSWRWIVGETKLVCNLSSWYVRPKYRAWAISLLTAAIRDDNMIYTALTPGSVSQNVLREFGFVPLAKIILPPLAHLETLSKSRATIGFEPDAVRRSLNVHHQQIFDDHAPYDCLQLILREGSEQAYMVVKRLAVHRRVPLLRTATKLRYSEILYCSEPSLLARHLEQVKLAILAKQRTLFLVADESMFPLRPRGIVKHYAMQKPGVRDLHWGDELYSELLLLPT